MLIDWSLNSVWWIHNNINNIQSYTNIVYDINTKFQHGWWIHSVCMYYPVVNCIIITHWWTTIKKTATVFESTQNWVILSLEELFKAFNGLQWLLSMGLNLYNIYTCIQFLRPDDIHVYTHCIVYHLWQIFSLYEGFCIMHVTYCLLINYEHFKQYLIVILIHHL